MRCKQHLLSNQEDGQKQYFGNISDLLIFPDHNIAPDILFECLLPGRGMDRLSPSSPPLRPKLDQALSTSMKAVINYIPKAVIYILHCDSCSIAYHRIKVYIITFLTSDSSV